MARRRGWRWHLGGRQGLALPSPAQKSGSFFFSWRGPTLACRPRLGKGNTVAAGGGPWGRDRKAVMVRKAPDDGMHVGVLATRTPHQSWFLEEAPGWNRIPCSLYHPQERSWEVLVVHGPRAPARNEGRKLTAKENLIPRRGKNNFFSVATCLSSSRANHGWRQAGRPPDGGGGCRSQAAGARGLFQSALWRDIERCGQTGGLQRRGK